MGQPKVDDHWKDRRGLAAALGVAMVVFPIASALGMTIAFDHLVPRPVTPLPMVGWVVAVLVLSTVVYIVTDRVARRALPLKVLLRMGLVFPDRAPRRLAVARRAASVRDLDRRVADARAHGIADTPTEAAKKIVTLAAAISAHDRMTRGHSERVRAVTDMIADELHLAAPDRARLRWSALLHDVGKLAVHPDVLNKADPLSDEEWRIIRLHPLEGAKLTAPLAAWLGPWASTIAEHHERFDGDGYPAGLAGKDISHGGRIVAVADSYDVMTAARSYKKPLGPGAARRELAACAGSQFDPEVVRAFLAVSVWRIRFVAPLSWIASLGVARFGAVARLGATSGQSVATGLAAAAGVIGLTIAAPVAHRVPLAVRHSVPPAVPTPAPHRTVTTVESSTSVPGAGAPTTSGPSTTLAPGTASAATTTTGPSSSSTTTSTTVPATTPTTAPPASTTTVAPSTTTSTTTITTTSTTTTVLSHSPTSPPTALSAVGGCELVVLGPDVTLTWRPSRTASVTRQVVLRGPDRNTLSTLKVVPSTATTYTDTSVAAGTTYWYAVEAVAPTGNATSDPVSATTPPLCLSTGGPGPAAGGHASTVAAAGGLAGARHATGPRGQFGAPVGGLVSYAWPLSLLPAWRRCRPTRRSTRRGRRSTPAVRHA